MEFVAHALVSRRLDLPEAPWKIIDHAVHEARQIVDAVNREMSPGKRRIEDLLRLVSCTKTNGECLPKRVRLPSGRMIALKGIVKQCQEFPKIAGAEAAPALAFLGDDHRRRR